MASNNNNKETGLSPIQESSDLDLSLLISQLSSVSGEITDRTLEELLRDAECQPPSLSWCRPKDESKLVKTNSRPNSPPIHGNVFKNAIDALSEISNRVQEKLTLDEGCDQAVTYRLQTSARSNAISGKKQITINKTIDVPQNPRKSPKKFSNQLTMSAAAKLYGKKLVKQSKSVQPMFVPTGKPIKVTVTPGCNKPQGKNGKIADKPIIAGGNKNERETSRLTEKTNFSPSDHQANKKEAVDSSDKVAEQLRQFEEKLSSIRETYQVQLDKFNQKLEEFEKLHQRPVIQDVQVQTDLPEIENRGNQIEVPKLNFDDLVLDSNLQSTAEISDKTLKAEKMTVRSFRDYSGFGNGEQRRLLNTIRKLQTELDLVKKINKRLEVQLKSSKPRTFGRNVVKRQIGTQTIGLGACSPQKYDPTVFQPSNDLFAENEDLKKKLETLAKEVEILNEQKAMSLRLLQIKHEEEIEILLEEKMQLSKKLDAVQNWTPW